MDIQTAMNDLQGLREQLPPMQEVFDLALDALREKADFVRCKYCEYWQDNNGGYPHEECRWGHDETPDADDFCSCGKRLAQAACKGQPMMNKDWPSYLDLPRKAGRSDGMNDNRIAEIQQQCEKRNTTNPIIFKNNLATVDVVRALMEEITSCNEDVTYLLAQLSTSQRREKAARNELCQKCGRYREAHKGACDGCRWMA